MEDRKVVMKIEYASTYGVRITQDDGETITDFIHEPELGTTNVVIDGRTEWTLDLGHNEMYTFIERIMGPIDDPNEFLPSIIRALG